MTKKDVKGVLYLSAGQLLLSPRGRTLIFTSKFDISDPSPVLTVEMAGKWYEMFLVYPDGKVEPVPFPTDPILAHDHVPNPHSVIELGKQKGYWIDEVAFELIVGRWETEVRDRYPGVNPG